MGKFLGVDIGRKLARGFRGKLVRCALIKVTSSPNPARPTVIVKTRTEHKCIGFWEEWPGRFPSQESNRSGTRVVRVDGMAVVLGHTLKDVEPGVNDEFRIRGQVYVITNIGDDPSRSAGQSATYKLTLRGV